MPHKTHAAPPGLAHRGTPTRSAATPLPLPSRRQDPPQAPAAAPAPTPPPAPAPPAAGGAPQKPQSPPPGADNPDDVTDDTGPDDPPPHAPHFVPFPAPGSTIWNPLITLRNGTTVNAYDHYVMSSWAPLCANGTIPDCPLGIPMPVLAHLASLGVWFTTAIFGMPLLALLVWGCVGKWVWRQSWEAQEEGKVEERKRRWAAREAHRRAAKGYSAAHVQERQQTVAHRDHHAPVDSSYPPAPPPKHPAGPRGYNALRPGSTVAYDGVAQGRRPHSRLPTITSSVRASTYMGSVGAGARRSTYNLLGPGPLPLRPGGSAGAAASGSASASTVEAPLLPLLRDGLPSPSPGDCTSSSSLLSPSRFQGGGTPLSPIDAQSFAATGTGTGTPIPTHTPTGGGAFPWFENSPSGTSYETPPVARAGESLTSTSKTSLIERPRSHAGGREDAPSSPQEESYDDFDVSFPSSDLSMSMSAADFVDPYAQTPASALRAGFGVGIGGVGGAAGLRRPRLSSAPRFSLRPGQLLDLARGHAPSSAAAAKAAFVPIEEPGSSSNDHDHGSDTSSPTLSPLRPQATRGAVAIDVPDGAGVQGLYRGRRQSQMIDPSGIDPAGTGTKHTATPSLDLAALQGEAILNLNVTRRRVAGPRRETHAVTASRGESYDQGHGQLTPEVSAPAQAQGDDPLSPIFVSDPSAEAGAGASTSPFSARFSGRSSVSSSPVDCGSDSQTRDLLADPRAWAPARQGGGGGGNGGPTWGEAALRRESALASLAGAAVGTGAPAAPQAAGVSPAGALTDRGRRAGLVLDQLQMQIPGLYPAPLGGYGRARESSPFSPLSPGGSTAVDEKDPSAFLFPSAPGKEPVAHAESEKQALFGQSKGAFSRSDVTLGDSTPPSTSYKGQDPFSSYAAHSGTKGGRPGTSPNPFASPLDKPFAPLPARGLGTSGPPPPTGPNRASLRAGPDASTPPLSAGDQLLAALLSDELQFIAASVHAADWGWRWRTERAGFADPMGLPSVVPGGQVGAGTAGAGAGAGAVQKARSLLRRGRSTTGGRYAATGEGGTTATGSTTLGASGTSGSHEPSHTTASATASATTYWRSIDTAQGHWKFANVSRFARGLDGVGLGSLGVLRHIPTSSAKAAAAQEGGDGAGTDLAELDVEVRKRIEEWFGNGESGPFFR